MTLRIALAGPIDVQALGHAAGMDLSSLPSGYGYSPLASLAGGLLREGHTVHAVTLDHTIETVEHHSFDNLILTLCPIRGTPGRRARSCGPDLFAKEIRLLSEVLRQSDADIVNAHWTYEFGEAAIRSGKPSLITMHDLGWNCLFALRDGYRLLRLIMKYRVMLRASHLSAVSPFVAGRAWQYIHFREVSIIPNPIEMAPIQDKCPDRPILVTVGNDARLKNVRASLTAYSAIRAAFPTAELHLFGPGLESGGKLDRGEPGIIFHGNVSHSQLMKFLETNATLLIHPSRTETFGLIIGEAKMRGVPVVAGSQAGGVPYVINDAGGVLVDIERPQEIARAAIEILSDENRYRILQQAAHDDVEERFSVEKVTAGYLAAYRQVLETSARQSTFYAA